MKCELFTNHKRHVNFEKIKYQTHLNYIFNQRYAAV